MAGKVEFVQKKNEFVERFNHDWENYKKIFLEENNKEELMFKAYTLIHLVWLNDIIRNDVLFKNYELPFTFGQTKKDRNDDRLNRYVRMFDYWINFSNNKGNMVEEFIGYLENIDEDDWAYNYSDYVWFFEDYLIDDSFMNLFDYEKE